MKHKSSKIAYALYCGFNAILFIVYILLEKSHFVGLIMILGIIASTFVFRAWVNKQLNSDVPPAVVPPTPKPRWEFIPGPVENIQQIAVPANSEFNLAAFQQAVLASYHRQNTKKMAYAAATIAKLISENFDTKDIRCMVPASQIAPNASHNTLPVHFLFMKNGQPKVAVVIVTSFGYKHPYVLATKDVCDKNGVAYLRVFANGNLADWLEGKAKPGVEDMCKFRIAYNIKRALN